MQSPIETTIARYFAATRAMDRRTWVECFAPNGVSHDPVGAPPNVGHAALGAFFDSIVGLVATIGLHEERVHVCGARAAVKWIGRGTSKTGKPFTFEGIDVFTCDAAGRIVALEAFWNPPELMAQLS